ncbi:unnamed protein product [Arabidopsis thaliana]|uniref:(thale cress) hypothetical protein n=1 Tax=Arabidopsis thaliana TaxID=3702 RepID=A0A7G2E815_ARATH|nr:unnamed protein product [Arabidopsis thaliana]
MISRVRERGKQPYWILNDQYQFFIEYWGTENAKERSKKASKSRMSDRNGLGPHKHRAGSCSYAKVADLLKEKTGNASYIDVLRQTHKMPDGSFVDERAKQISEGFEKNVADLLEDENPLNEELTLEKKNEMYLKIVEARNGRVFGLGALLSEFSLKCGVSAILENHVENEQALKQQLEEIYQENLKIKERLTKLEGWRKCLS